MPTVFLNGKFLDRDDARISAFDAGFQHAVGLFETMTARLEGGEAEVFRLEAHLDRLIGSARDLGLSDSLKKHALAEAVCATVEQAGLGRSRVRLTITGGDLNLLGRSDAATKRRSDEGADPTVLIVAQPATTYPPEMFERGVSVVFADARANPLNPFEGHKTLNYWWRLRELQVAASKRAAEAVVLQVSNHLCGGCVSNLFIVRDGSLHTPISRGEEERGAIPSPVLPGVVRGAVLEWAAEQRIGVSRRMLSASDLMDADEVFLTNSSWGILPVVKVEAEAIGDGVVGEVSRAMRARWEAATGPDGMPSPPV
jgi:branched-chain amino acid aminotransferase